MRTDPIPSTGSSAPSTPGATPSATPVVTRVAGTASAATPTADPMASAGQAVTGEDGLTFPSNFVMSKGQREQLAAQVKQGTGKTMNELREANAASGEAEKR